MFDAAECDTCSLRYVSCAVRGEFDILARAVGVGGETPFVHALGDEPADVGMHASRFAEEESFVVGNDGVEDGGVVFAQCGVEEGVLQTGEAGETGMRALHRLLELHLIAKEYQVGCASSDRNRVRERHLSRFIDEEVVECVLPFRSREEPCGSTDNTLAEQATRGAACVNESEPRIVGVDRVLFFTTNLDPHEITSILSSRITAGGKEVDHCLVTVRGNADRLPRCQKLSDDTRGRVGLPRPRRTLYDQASSVHRRGYANGSIHRQLVLMPNGIGRWCPLQKGEYGWGKRTVKAGADDVGQGALYRLRRNELIRNKRSMLWEAAVEFLVDLLCAQLELELAVHGVQRVERELCLQVVGEHHAVAITGSQLALLGLIEFVALCERQLHFLGFAHRGHTLNTSGIVT